MINPIKDKKLELDNEIKELVLKTDGFNAKLKQSKKDIERRYRELSGLLVEQQGKKPKKSKVRVENIENSFFLAIDNVVNYGDTDIFPFPYETRMFEDIKPRLIERLLDVFDNFDDYLIESPPVNISTCSTVGYTGFRWATQVDPFWNVFYLGLCIAISPDIEGKRVSKEKVYSYRYLPNLEKGSLFDLDVNWKKFQESSLNETEADDKIKYVLSFDIADFYTRIYHHRLENALDRIDPNKIYSSKIKDLIQQFSGTNSYGLPVGCPASRILAELSLDSFDHLLEVNGFIFKRFVDDYVVFCSSEEDAHSKLIFISRKLMENEGLTLQKQKTSVMSREEFIGLTKAKLYGVKEDEGSTHKAKFMSLPIRFDPYSDDPSGDYDDLKKSLNSFDLLGMLASELQKSKIDQNYSKHLIKALQAKNDNILSDALIVVFTNINSLYPIFIKIIQVSASNWDRLSLDCQNKIREVLKSLLEENSFILQVELNTAFVCKLISKDNSVDNQILLTKIYSKNIDSMLISLVVIQVMAKWNVHYWLSDLKRSFSTMNPWQRRMFIVSSFFLGDEGKHWRDHNKKSFNFIEQLYSLWAAKRKNANTLEKAL